MTTKILAIIAVCLALACGAAAMALHSDLAEACQAQRC
jgi:hypothetical protein